MLEFLHLMIMMLVLLIFLLISYCKILFLIFRKLKQCFMNGVQKQAKMLITFLNK